MAYHRGPKRIVWLLIGAAVGAGVAMLYAPKTGRDTRKFIRRRAEDARGAISDAGESVREFYDSVSDAGHGAYDTVVGAGRDAYKKTAGVASGAADVFERGRKFMMG